MKVVRETCQIRMVRSVVPTDDASVTLDKRIAVPAECLVEVEIQHVATTEFHSLLGQQIVDGLYVGAEGYEAGDGSIELASHSSRL